MALDRIMNIDKDSNSSDEFNLLKESQPKKIRNIELGKRPGRVSTAGHHPRRKRTLLQDATDNEYPQKNEKSVNMLLQKTESKLDLLQKRLEECQGEDGIMDPNKIFNALNFVQKEDNPDAYVPDIVIMHRKK